MPTPPIEITPLERPFNITFPDVEKGIPPIPGSKSLTNRALPLAALADGKSILTGVLFSDDTRVMMQALQNLGFTLDIDEPNHTVTVHGQGGKIPADNAEIFLGNSGTSMRFLTAMCALGTGKYTLDGIPRMRERPIADLVGALETLDAVIYYNEDEGYPPLYLNSNGLRHDDGESLTELPANTSSQFISAVLMAGACAEDGITLRLTGDIVSRPYIEMTLALMKQFGAEVELLDDLRCIRVKQTGYRAMDYAIEPDASSVSYFTAAAAAVPGSQCTIKHLGTASLQGDVDFAHELAEMGASTELADTSTTVSSSPSSHLRGYTQDLNHIPDAAMTIATLAILADGPTTIRNVGNWRVKETDRMAAMETELRKLGATVSVNGDDITITPPASGKTTPAAIDTYDDHRIAMAFSVIGLAQPGVTINDPDCVNKTFPDFFKYLDYLRQSARD